MIYKTDKNLSIMIRTDILLQHLWMRDYEI